MEKNEKFPNTRECDVHHTLKNAQKRLIRGVGGIEEAAEHSRVAKSTIGNAVNREHPGHLPVDVILGLEDLLGETPVTSAMARLSGYRLAKSDEVDCAMEISEVCTRLSLELGEVAKAAVATLECQRQDFGQRRAVIDAFSRILSIAQAGMDAIEREAPAATIGLKRAKHIHIVGEIS